MLTETSLRDLPERRRAKPLPVGTRVLTSIDENYYNVNDEMVDFFNHKEGIIQLIRTDDESVFGEPQHSDVQGYRYKVALDCEQGRRVTAGTYVNQWNWHDIHLVVLPPKDRRLAKPELPDF